MSDPLNPWEDKDRLEPSGDLSPDAEGLTGIMNTVGAGLRPGVGPGSDTASADTNASATADTNPDTDPAPDANDLEADNPVEQETIETVDPANPPA